VEADEPTSDPRSPSGTGAPQHAYTERPAVMANEPAVAPRPATATTTTTADQATIGKSLVIKGEVTGSESLYIDGRVEGRSAWRETASPSGGTA